MQSNAAIRDPADRRDGVPPALSAEEDARQRAEEQRRAEEARGGQVPVCVRTCDGFFFPVNYQGADGRYGDVCRASCPGASTELFWMRGGADIEHAVSARGGSYAALPAAFAFRRSYSETCSCKARDESWGRALRQAEELIGRKGDIVVTAESSQRMAQPEGPDCAACAAATGAPEAEAEEPEMIARSDAALAEPPPAARKVRLIPPARAAARP